ncbi:MULTISPECIES: gas vesicle protein [Alkalihalophilus]|uniref:Gas vesicle synthesis protein n=1 Tax=Alkalihalophilus pseudofirmus (strain ATCC BAA-2126 / JCM 17055 / OF4) TaxID=398511 RepID=D3FQB3_ALKPO|nr:MULTISPECIES: gas vesicle protein [Alkalihalophilus]ADC49585.1 gas vesicle synthesis protein [Alkalihalophilus pseudofirmus OF4]MEC2074034.1 gas vesicle protein [Alkalihalophilus marmarensis]MED1600482.1 gas vesicle protein [Alkalihalophilus marmarensis]OLS38679.1 gas vesicle protein [Alkalihalophilus pseudofirmus]WEG16923.1 gas vesicle protein [Alkalihalophilus pseudofirmus]
MAVEHSMQSSTIVDVLEKILDKGVVIAGDITVGIADVELLTIKIRLIVASVDKAKEIGMDWWETDPYLSSKASNNSTKALEEENEKLKERLESLENKLNTNRLDQTEFNY